MFNLRSGTSNLRTPNFYDGADGNANAYPEPLSTGKQMDWAVLQDESFHRFLGQPIGPVPMQTDVFTPIFMNPNFSHAGPISSAISGSEWEPASAQSAAILEALLGKLAMLNMNDQEQADISHQLNYLFVPSRIEKFTNCYFQFWHPHCPMVHRPSFSIDAEPVPLLIAMTLMGAMYSQVEHEVDASKIALDLAELFIYSIEDFADEFEVQQMLRYSSAPNQAQPSMPSYLALKNLQAAYLMVVVQTWAGNMAARKRAMETRFSTAIKVIERDLMFNLF